VQPVYFEFPIVTLQKDFKIIPKNLPTYTTASFLNIRKVILNRIFNFQYKIISTIVYL